MATTGRFLKRCLASRVSLQYTRPNIVAPCVTKQSYTGNRGYLSEATLKLESLKQRIVETEQRYGEVKDDFKVKVMQHSMDNAEALHEDDLLTFIYLSTPEEVDNVVNLANQYEAQDSEIKLRVGPIVMRFMYVHGLIDKALQYIYSKPLSSHQATSLSICLDMLYEAQRYDECAKLATDVLNIKEAKDLLSNAVLELAIVACFKVNTLESLKQSAKLLDAKRLQLQKRHQEADEPRGNSWVTQSHKLIQQLVVLQCIRQQHFNAAINLLDLDTTDNSRMSTDITICNLKMQALIGLNNAEGAQKLLWRTRREKDRELEQEGYEVRTLDKTTADKSDMYRQSLKTGILYTDTYQKFMEVDPILLSLAARKFLAWLRFNRDTNVLWSSLENKFLNMFPRRSDREMRSFRRSGRMDSAADIIAMTPISRPKSESLIQQSQLSATEATEEDSSAKTEPVEATTDLSAEVAESPAEVTAEGQISSEEVKRETAV